MARPKGDDDVVDGGHAKHLDAGAKERPGVYVQVADGPRRHKSSSSHSAHQSGDHPLEETATRPGHPGAGRRGPGPMGMGAGAPQRAEPKPYTRSEVRERTAPAIESAPAAVRPVAAQSRARGQIVEVNESVHDARAESENTNHRADIVRVPSVYPSMPPGSGSVPPASLPPTADRNSVPSVLDARPRFNTDPPVVPSTPWGLITLVAVLSSIIAAAGVIALQEWMREKPTQAVVSAPVAAPPAARPAAAPAPVPVPAASPEAAPAAAVAAPAAVVAAPATDSGEGAVAPVAKRAPAAAPIARPETRAVPGERAPRVDRVAERVAVDAERADVAPEAAPVLDDVPDNPFAEPSSPEAPAAP